MTIKKKLYCTVMAFVISSSIAVFGNVVLRGMNLQEGIGEALAGGIGGAIALFYLLSRKPKKMNR
jgi:hypothetical protein